MAVEGSIVVEGMPSRHDRWRWMVGGGEQERVAAKSGSVGLIYAPAAATQTMDYVTWNWT